MLHVELVASMLRMLARLKAKRFDRRKKAASKAAAVLALLGAVAIVTDRDLAHRYLPQVSKGES